MRCAFLLLAAVVCVTAAVVAASSEQQQRVAIPLSSPHFVTPRPNSKIPRARHRSLFGACRRDIVSHDCLNYARQDGTAAGRRHAVEATVECLLRKQDKLQDVDCLRWILARERCLADAKRESACDMQWKLQEQHEQEQEVPPPAQNGEDDPNNNPRPPPPQRSASRAKRKSAIFDSLTACLLSVDERRLSHECRSSDYFTSLSFQRRWRDARDANVKRYVVTKRDE